VSKIQKKNSGGHPLFDRVASILSQVRANTLRAINSNMVLAHWLIGREIVQEIPGGKGRAKYGKKVIGQLSADLTEKYGRGYSTTNLKYIRDFYKAYSHRIPDLDSIRYPVGSELIKGDLELGNEDSEQKRIRHFESDEFNDENQIGFMHNLGWSHYRILMRIKDRVKRRFYEVEAANKEWTKRHLQRQVNTFLYERLLKSKDRDEVLSFANKGQEVLSPADAIKEPLLLDFLGLPDLAGLHESDLEKAIIDNLQSFLLELGKGFAFVGRQRQMQFEDKCFYIDLVFYNYKLKCFLLIDLKIGELTHHDIGQMDGYVRMFNDKYIERNDSPTIGLILCSEKNETIAKYSVLSDDKQLFASKYMLYLPSEESLQNAVDKKRKEFAVNSAKK